jgi:tetratricopeptide (TPR) repeat protein
MTKRAWGPWALLFLATLLAYAPAFRAGFVWDDDDHVTKNPMLESADGLRRIWLDAGSTPQYYPLVHTTFWIERHLWGLEPAGYHAVNVVLHALSAIVLWRLLVLLEVPGAWLAAALFALHPVHVESVAWVSERKNVLSGLLYLLSALVLLREILALRETRERGRWALLLGFVLYLAALLSKTVTASLPVAIALVVGWKRGRFRRAEVVLLAAMLATGVLLAQLTVALETHQIGTAGMDWSLTAAERILVAGRAFWFYLGKLLYPANLTFLYPRWSLDQGLPWTWLFPAAAVAALGALLALRKRIGAGPFVALAFFTVTLAPALGFFDLYPMRYTFVADHYQYLASIGPLALLAAGGRHLPARALRAAGAAVLLVLAALTFERTLAYRNAETLWRDTIARNPGSWMAHNNLAILLAERGEAAGAVEHFEASLAIRPDHAAAHANLGYLLERGGDLDAAIAHLDRAAALAPDDFNARVHLGDALLRKGRPDEAARHYLHALRVRPGDAEAAARLGGAGLALARQGRSEDAIEVFRAAARSRPDDADLAYDLGTLLARAGRPAEAVPLLEAAVRLRPGFAEAERNLALARRDAGLAR